jgi:hypothetical protein
VAQARPQLKALSTDYAMAVPYRPPIPMHEWPAECLWAQLQQERSDKERQGSNYTDVTYLDNLERHWSDRGVCSRCLRDIDQGLDEQFSELQARAENAEDKLGRIRKAVMERPDIVMKPEIIRILDEP